MTDVTCIYYSSNRERPDFEKRIQQNILASGLPIISVTQEPMDFGKNIRVGNKIGISGFNMFRQVQIGLREAKTKYVVSCEADCLYPPDYFTTIPDNEKPHRNTNLYVMPDARDFFFYKREGATHAQIVGRDYYLHRLNELFDGAPLWSPEEKNFPKERTGDDDVFTEVEYYRTENPVVQIKTHRGMRYFTHSSREPIYSLPYWGKGPTVRAYYLHGRDV